MFLGADKLLFEKAATLRRQQTFAEEILWDYLRTKPLGFKFRRQHPLASYILDFYCHRLKFAIEVDGSIHQKENDEIRQKQLEEGGLSFIRFTNDQIILRLEGVIQQIESHLQRQLVTHKDSST